MIDKIEEILKNYGVDAHSITVAVCFDRVELSVRHKIESEITGLAEGFNCEGGGTDLLNNASDIIFRKHFVRMSKE